MIFRFKYWLALLLRALGILSLIRRRQSNRLLILCYHRVFRDARALSDYFFPGMAISEAMFEKQMQCLAAHYRVIPFSEAVDRIKSGKLPHGTTVVITFDDGYLDNYLWAYPILQRYQLPATFFLVSDFVGSAGLLWFDKLGYILRRAGSSAKLMEIVHAHFPAEAAERLRATLCAEAMPTRERIRALVGTLKAVPGSAVARGVDALAESFPEALADASPDDHAMTWDMVKQLRQSGMEIGSHSRTHPILTGLSEAEWTDELRDSKRTLEQRLDAPVPWFCYPNGDYNKAVQRSLIDLGYKAACSLEPGANDSINDLMALRRINVNEQFSPDLSGAFSESLFMAELAGVFDWLLLRNVRHRR